MQSIVSLDRSRIPMFFNRRSKVLAACTKTTFFVLLLSLKIAVSNSISLLAGTILSPPVKQWSEIIITLGLLYENALLKVYVL
jgi:hypothetical protein